MKSGIFNKIYMAPILVAVILLLSLMSYNTFSTTVSPPSAEAAKTTVSLSTSNKSELQNQITDPLVQKTTKVQPESKMYVQITEGCWVKLDSSCLNVRSGPGTEYKSVKKLRIGAMFLVKQVVKGEDDKLWYQIIADPIRPNKYGKWFVSSDYVKEIAVRTSIPDPLPGEPVKRIEIDLSEQKLRAYEDDKVVMETKVSTGIRRLSTPQGNLNILYSRASSYMKGADYDLPGVPFDLYITWTGVALHGAYWHDNFGKRMSHGCINMPTDVAEWVYNWVNTATKVKVS